MQVWGLWSIVPWEFVLPGCEWVIRCISVQFHDELTSAYLQRASNVPLTIHFIDLVGAHIEAMHPSGTQDLRTVTLKIMLNVSLKSLDKFSMVGRDGEQEGGPL